MGHDMDFEEKAVAEIFIEYSQVQTIPKALLIIVYGMQHWIGCGAGNVLKSINA